tara:strand:- start:291 stop:548 length:258 start_codon:yes stop_codon:yes gene_type:complete
MYNFVYKNNVISIKKQPNENKIEFNIRKWFIIKNYELVIQKKMSVNELHNFANVYIKMYRYDCEFDASIENEINEIVKDSLFIKD